MRDPVLSPGCQKCTLLKIAWGYWDMGAYMSEDAVLIRDAYSEITVSYFIRIIPLEGSSSHRNILMDGFRFFF